MSAAPAPPGAAALLTAWTLQPVALVVAALAVAAYARAVVRTPGWPVARTVAFGAGTALGLWTTSGFLQVYGRALFWVWTTQALTLLLVVPVLLMAGQPLELARRRGSRLGRLPESRAGRVLANPLVGPLLIPLVSAALVFGPVAGATIAATPVGSVAELVLVVVGAAVALPLVTASTAMTSLAVGLALAIGLVELLLDAVPGFALRLQTHVTTSFFAHRVAAGWEPRPLRDQQTAGAILWAVAESIDLPFLLLVFRQWLRADAREARTVDTVLEAESIARGGDAAAGAPWWETDPALRDRYR